MNLLTEVLQERTDALLGQLDKDFLKPAGRKVRAMVLTGAIHLATAKDRNQLIEVVIWTLDSADNLQAKWVGLRGSASGISGQLQRYVTIGADTLRQAVNSTVDQLNISSTAAKTIASEAARSLRGAGREANSGGLLLALGSIWFQQDSLHKNILALERTLPGNSEVVAAVWSSSVAYIGAVVEASGFTLKLLAPKLNFPAFSAHISAGELLVKTGGVIVALTGIIDGLQFFSAGLRARRSRDLKSEFQYQLASTFAFGSAAFGVAGAWGSGALLGPLGVAIIFGLTAYALASLAKHNESSAIELWSRKTLWGIPRNSRAWTCFAHLDDAIGALNAAVVGVQVDASIQIRFAPHDNTGRADAVGIVQHGQSIPAALSLGYFISLPSFRNELSQFNWTLNLFRAGQTVPLATLSGDQDSSSETPVIDAKSRTIFSSVDNVVVATLDSSNQVLTIKGEHLLSDGGSVSALELRINYWPDKDDMNGCARITLREDKIQLF